MAYTIELENSKESNFPDVIQQAGDAVLAVFSFVEPDTFSFETQGIKPMGLTQGDSTSNASKTATTANVMKTTGAFLIDSMLTNLVVRSSKESHTGTLTARLKDPNNALLSLLNPGDWVVCWIFNNTKDADTLRAQIKAGKFDNLNSQNSGLKFVGKVFSTRMNKSVLQNGAIVKYVNLICTSFSEFDSAIYYDPMLTRNLGGLEFQTQTSLALNKAVALPTSVNGMLSKFITLFLGYGEGSEKNPNKPLRVPEPVARILGRSNAQTFLDVLNVHIGVEQYKDTYLSQNLSSSVAAKTKHERNIRSNHPSIKFTPHGLIGYINPIVNPFVNVPIWSILQQYSVPVANEMFTTLRWDGKSIVPHLIIRQIPFNTDDFIKNYSNIPATAFRSLPRWRITDKLITAYDTGKSNALRANYVWVQASGALKQPNIPAAVRAGASPRWDIADIERNGLKAYITSVNATYEPAAITSTNEWTSLTTDRLMGGHLKLSGSINAIGFQEPIAVGDNLEYDGFVYHIETVEHRLVLSEQTGHKSFSTLLAISNGVPATGPVLPLVATRRFATDTTVTEKTIAEKADVPVNSVGDIWAEAVAYANPANESAKATIASKKAKGKRTRTVIQKKQTLMDTLAAVVHSNTPATNIVLDGD